VQTLPTLVIVIIFIAFGVFIFRFFYKAFEKIHSHNDEQIKKGFCDKCLSNTLPESCESVSSLNWIGSSFAYIGERCDKCDSYIVQQQNIFLGIPIKKNDKYRVISSRSITMSPAKRESFFISRKLKDS